MQSLNSELFKTLEAEKMNIVSGGKMVQQELTKGVDCCSMTSKGSGTTGSNWDGEDPYTD